MSKYSKKRDNQQEIKNQESQDKENINNEQEEIKEDDQYEILRINPDDLNPHEMNTKIYGNNESVDLELAKSIRENGQLVPIVITKDPKTKKLCIVSGHRRWLALKEINIVNKELEEDILPAKCIYREYKNEDQITEAIIEYNRQRKKVASQIYKEAVELDKILGPLAKERRKRNSVVPNLAQQKEEKDGRTIVQEADTLGLGKETLRKLKFIGDVSSQENQKYEHAKRDAAKILKDLDEGKLSYDAAYNKLRLICISQGDTPQKSYAGKLVSQIENAEKFRDNVWKKFEIYKDSTTVLNKIPSTNHTEETNKSENIRDSHSIIVTDLTKYTEKEAKVTKFTDNEDVALFLWADASNIKDRINLLEKCGFILKTIGIWLHESIYTNYFWGATEFLLLGIKGTIANSDYKPFVILNNDSEERNEDSEVNKSLIYKIVEDMFPNKKYIDLDKDPQREGWNDSIKEDISNLTEVTEIV